MPLPYSEFFSEQPRKLIRAVAEDVLVPHHEERCGEDAGGVEGLGVLDVGADVPFGEGYVVFEQPGADPWAFRACGSGVEDRVVRGGRVAGHVSLSHRAGDVEAASGGGGPEEVDRLADPVVQRAPLDWSKGAA